jgi:hypothetical protein
LGDNSWGRRANQKLISSAGYDYIVDEIFQSHCADFHLFKVSVSFFKISIERFVEILRQFLMLKKLPSSLILLVDLAGKISYSFTISGVLSLQLNATYSDFVGFVLIFAIVLNSWMS